MVSESTSENRSQPDCVWQSEPFRYCTHTLSFKQCVEACNQATVDTVCFARFSTALGRNNVTALPNMSTSCDAIESGIAKGVSRPHSRRQTLGKLREDSALVGG